jgi:hypothetical protein
MSLEVDCKQVKYNETRVVVDCVLYTHISGVPRGFGVQISPPFPEKIPGYATDPYYTCSALDLIRETTGSNTGLDTG